MTDRMPENFIPWEQIEPLIEPGMTGVDLHRRLCERLGLSPERYHFRLVRGSASMPLVEMLRHGVTIRRYPLPKPPRIAPRERVALR